jgi:hypothetical protein
MPPVSFRSTPLRIGSGNYPGFVEPMPNQSVTGRLLKLSMTLPIDFVFEFNRDLLTSSSRNDVNRRKAGLRLAMRS